MIDIQTISATGIGIVVLFAIVRCYLVWKRWSETSKQKEEIEIDKKIADAIKRGDTEMVAKLRKYLLRYKK